MRGEAIERNNIPNEKAEFARHLCKVQTPAEDIHWQLLGDRERIPTRFSRYQSLCRRRVLATLMSLLLRPGLN